MQVNTRPTTKNDSRDISKPALHFEPQYECQDAPSSKRPTSNSNDIDHSETNQIYINQKYNIERNTNKELDLESTRKLIASLISQTMKTKNKTQSENEPVNKIDKSPNVEDISDNIPCKDIDTIFTSNTFTESSDLDVEIQGASKQILRFTCHPERFPRPEDLKPKPKRRLPVLSRIFFKLPHTSDVNELCVIAVGGLECNRQLLHRFVPSKDRWDVWSALPEPRHRHALTALQHVVYFAGGVDMKSLVSSFEYVCNLENFK